MGHELVPRSGTLLTSFEVARRLRDRFRYVRVDEGEGQAAALAHATWIERANPNVFLGRHEEALRYARRLRNLMTGEALAIVFGDDSEHCRRITVLPEQRIQVGYAGDADEIASRDLVTRCAQALECDIVVF